ncbi:hypothetical protein B484DRAFT_317105, partial [Ochromonadaceae sp. CCMP2298]
YRKEYDRSISDPLSYWDEKAKQHLTWASPYTSITEGGFEAGDVQWFTGGKLNVCYNCVDRHLPEKADQTA